MIYVLVLLAAGIVVGVGATWALRRRRVPSAPVTEEAPVDTTPMTGLESALAQVKDRSGRPIGERIEAEHVDDLRVPDDTGPLLRRALDHVRPTDHDGDGAASATADAAADEADDTV